MPPRPAVTSATSDGSGTASNDVSENDADAAFAPDPPPMAIVE